MVNASAFFSYHNSSSTFNVVLWTIYAFIVVTGIFQNVIILFIVCKNKTMHTTTNYLLSNLAAADLVSLIVLPVSMVVNITGINLSGITGQVVCKAFTGNFLLKVPKTAGFSSLIFLATDRYYAIATPFDIRFRLTKDNVGFAIGLTWALAVPVCLPFVIWSEFNEGTKHCLGPWSIEKAVANRFYIATIAALFVGGSGLLIYCYGQILRGIFITRTVCSGNIHGNDHVQLRAKKKLTVTSLAVSVSFWICYSPSICFQLCVAFISPETVRNNYEMFYVLHSLGKLVLFLGSSLDPLLYAFQSFSYRKNLKAIFTKERKARVQEAVGKEIEMAKSKGDRNDGVLQ